MPHPFLSYAFRPFFLLNGLFAMVVISVWLAALHGIRLAAPPAAMLYWHGHEMVVGFAMAAVAGFVLTAVATWTGRPPLQGKLLGVLVFSWLCGRLIMMTAAWLPYWLVASVDSIFPFLLALLLGREVLGGGNRRNYPIVGIILVLAGLNLLYHLGVMRIVPGMDRLALYLLIHIVLLMITVIAGRIIPNFTANWLRARGHERLPASHALLDGVTVVATIATGVSVSLDPSGPVSGILATVAALAHAVRLARWRGLATVSEPLLFVLHVAYLWLPAGYALTALAAFDLVLPASAALHALTMGGIGNMILAVTTRVALAHTGRALHAPRLIAISYAILNAAVVARVLSPLDPGRYLQLIDLSALGWIATFAIFSWVYWPVLTRRRVD
ncbi:MAG: NnrS family protein [Gammaproteobacteria bacterium]|nr:MAG: NnrS family protein [Gammaproteobacteria bacterium]